MRVFGVERLVKHEVFDVRGAFDVARQRELDRRLRAFHALSDRLVRLLVPFRGNITAHNAHEPALPAADCNLLLPIAPKLCAPLDRTSSPADGLQSNCCPLYDSSRAYALLGRCLRRTVETACFGSASIKLGYHNEFTEREALRYVQSTLRFAVVLFVLGFSGGFCSTRIARQTYQRSPLA